MKEKEDFPNIRDQHTNGLGVQYLLAIKSKLILDELREIQPKLKQETAIKQFFIVFICVFR